MFLQGIHGHRFIDAFDCDGLRIVDSRSHELLLTDREFCLSHQIMANVFHVRICLIVVFAELEVAF